MRGARPLIEPANTKLLVPFKLEEKAYALLGEEFDWESDKKQVEKEGPRAVVKIEHTAKIKQLLTEIVEQLPPNQRGRFKDVDVMLEGCSSFLKLRSREKARSKDVGDHDIYKAWYKARKTAYLIIVTDATDAVSVNFFGRCKFLQI